MNKVEELLREKKRDIDHIEIPEEMEGRLRQALSSKPVIKKKGYKIGKIAAACLILFLVGYNFDTLAFYSKQIIGYQGVMNGTLRQLNELGKGQVINKGYDFKDDVSIVVDGIMLDENQLLVFYTIEAPGGNADEMMPSFRLQGLLGEYWPRSGEGVINDTNTIIKNKQSFEAPHFLEKTLKLKMTILRGDTLQEGEITFKIDREKAMGHTLKTNINKGIQVGKNKIHIDTLLASPTRTVIKGTIQNSLELIKDELTGERLRPGGIEMKLMANGKEIERQGSGMRTDLKGSTFNCDYDALPQDLQSLTLEIISFLADHDVSEKIDLKKEEENQIVNIDGQEIMINKVYESEGSTFVNITTEEGVVLTSVYLVADDKQVELEQTIGGEYDKPKDGKILHTRTLEFKGIGKKYALDIRSIRHLQYVNEMIDLPIK